MAAPRLPRLLQHVEGGNWDYVAIGRYDSWPALAADQTDAGAEPRERTAGLTRPPRFELREHMSFHTDTIAERVPTQVAKK